MKIILLVLGGLLFLAIFSVGVFLFLTRFADGPKGPIPGGELVSGPFVDANDTDWAETLGDQLVTEVELQLVNPIGSRTTGAFAYDGQLYIPCDLGFVWRRLPNGIPRVFLHTLWLFKDWHQKVVVDGRVIVRFRGNRYKLNAVRVTDEGLMDVFRERISTAAGRAFQLLDVETNPNDVWFFRLDPRADTSVTQPK